MKKFATKTGSIILTVILCMGCNVMSFAADTEFTKNSDEMSTGIVITTTKEERDAQFESFMKTFVPSTVTRGSQYHYKTEYLDYQYKTLAGYAGNQVDGGYRFKTGGGFWFTDSSGPSVSGSVILSLPAPFNVVSARVNLGKNGSSGLFVNAPDTKNFYKLYVSKVMEVRPYALYRARSGTQDWELYMTGGVSLTYSVDAYAKKFK